MSTMLGGTQTLANNMFHRNRNPVVRPRWTTKHADCLHNGTTTTTGKHNTCSECFTLRANIDMSTLLLCSDGLVCEYQTIRCPTVLLAMLTPSGGTHTHTLDVYEVRGANRDSPAILACVGLPVYKRTCALVDLKHARHTFRLTHDDVQSICAIETFRSPPRTANINTNTTT